MLFKLFRLKFEIERVWAKMVQYKIPTCMHKEL